MEAVDDPAGTTPSVRFSSAALKTFATQLTVAVLNLASVLLVARVLGPAGRGTVAFLTAMAALSSGLASFGVEEATVNLAGSEPGTRRQLAGNAVVLAILLGAGCAALLAVLSMVFPAFAGPSTASSRLLVYAALPALMLKVFLKFLIGADYRFGIANASWLLPPVATLVVNAGLAVAGRLTITTVFATWVVAHSVAAALLVWFVAVRGAGFGRPDAALARRSLAFGWRSHLGRVMMVGNYRLDLWIVGAVAGPRELGVYSIAVAWSEVLFYLPTALVIVQRPFLVRASRREAGHRAARIFRSSLPLTFASTVTVFLLAPFLCATVFGSEFAPSTRLLRILALGAFGVMALQLLGSAVTAQRRPTLSSAATAVAFLVTVVLDVVLIPAYGGLGAAIASCLAYTAGGAAMVLIFTRALGASAQELLPRPPEVRDDIGRLHRTLRNRARPSKR